MYAPADSGTDATRNPPAQRGPDPRCGAGARTPKRTMETYTMSTDKAAQAVPPHPVLAGHYQAADQRVGYIRRLFDESASSYDRINAWMSLRTGDRYRYDALSRTGLCPGQTVLDIACGTGVMAAYAQDLVAPTGIVLALDPSLPMLTEARNRGVRTRIAGVAEALPVADASADLISMGYALRHMADLRVGFGEMLRVLRPGGRLLILEMVPPRSVLGYTIAKIYLKHLVPTVTAWVTRNAQARRLMEYYWETVDLCVPPTVVLNTLREVGFDAVQRSIMFGLFTEYTARRPDAPEAPEAPEAPDIQSDCGMKTLPP